MSFEQIINPLTNRKVTLNSKLGKSIIFNYIKQFGGYIDRLTTKTDFNISLGENIKNNIFTSQTDQVILNINLESALSGGKSGDFIYKISESRQNFMIKVFSAGNDPDINEINNHLKFMELFADVPNYLPCPIIYTYGVLTGYLPFSTTQIRKGDYLNYIIMEELTPFYELYTFLNESCSRIKLSYYLDTKDIIFQLFYILSVMQLNSLSHCDLHSKNIMIVPNTSDITINFGIIDIPKLHKIGKFIIKIIDFGESTETRCTKNRTTSVAISQLLKKCTGSSHLGSLVAGEVLGSAGIVDINFFIRIIEIIASFDIRFKIINISTLWTSSNEMAISAKSTKSTKKIILRNIFSELLKI
jgi:serine/threonine protein kinase